MPLLRRQRYALLIAAAGMLLGLAVWGWIRPPDPMGGEGHTLLPSIGAELFYLDASSITRRGAGRVWVVRINEPVELVPYHFRTERLDGPQTVEAWQEHLGAPLVFNAGQFDEDLNHLGWLKGNGSWLSRHLKRTWKGLLVTGPTDDAWWGRVVDLEDAEATEVDQRYRNIIQSMMLVDEHGALRVRDTDRTATRTVVAEDTQGRLLLVFTEGAMTLADLARWLPSTQLHIVRAMNLDGGIESQLVIRTPELQTSFHGQYGTGTTVFDAGQMIRYPLPAVVALRTHPAPVSGSP